MIEIWPELFAITLLVAAAILAKRQSRDKIWLKLASEFPVNGNLDLDQDYCHIIQWYSRDWEERTCNATAISVKKKGLMIAPKNFPFGLFSLSPILIPWIEIYEGLQRQKTLNWSKMIVLHIPRLEISIAAPKKITVHPDWAPAYR